MTKGKVYFRGLLANVDSSITNIKLDYGFKIEKMHIDEASAFISLWPSYNQAILFDKGCVKDHYVYYISNSLCVENLKDPFSPELYKFKNSYINGYEKGYLDNILKIMRLYQKGDISIPITLFYYLENGIPHLKSGGMKAKYGPGDFFELNDTKVNELQALIQNRKYYTLIENPEINRALSFFIDRRGELRCMYYYKVYEIINKDLNRDNKSITCLGVSNTKIRHFKHTMNYLCGIHSRHAHEHGGKPMNINEAEDLIRYILKKWIDRKMR